jgi:hypothetical protein
MALVAAELGSVHRRDERRAVGLAQGVSCPRPEPVVRVHDVGLPREEAGAELRDLMVAGDDLRERVVVRHPGQVDVRAQHPHALDDGVVGCIRVRPREHHDLVSRASHRGGQAVHVRSESADDERRVLPADHRDAHERPTLPGRRAMLPWWFGPPTSRLRWRG